MEKRLNAAFARSFKQTDNEAMLHDMLRRVRAMTLRQLAQCQYIPVSRSFARSFVYDEYKSTDI